MDLCDCVAEVILAKKVVVTALNLTGNSVRVKLKSKERERFFSSFISKENFLTNEYLLEINLYFRAAK